MASASDTVKSLIARQNGSWKPVFSAPSASNMDIYFTAGFNGDWDAAMVYNDRVPVCDGDPITGYQEVIALTLLSASETVTSGTTADVTTLINVTTADGITIQANPTFHMLADNTGVWRIDDIDYHLTSLQADGSVQTHDSFRADLKSLVASASASVVLTSAVIGYTSSTISSIPQAIAASGKVYGDGTSAGLLETIFDGIGDKTAWIAADQVLGESIPLGTAIAAFDQNGTVVSCGILVSQVFTDPGGGLYIFMQWAGQQANIKYVPADGTPADSAQYFCVIAK